MRAVLRYTAKYTLWLLGGLLLVVVLLVAILMWRLTTGPLQVGFLTPYLERALEDPQSGRRAVIRDVVLAWNARSRALSLIARGLTVRNADGTTLATFPAVTVTPSLQAFLHGRVAVSAVAFEGVRVILTRDTNGAFHLGSGPRSAREQSAKRMVSAQGQDLSQIVSDVARQFMSDPDTLPATLQPLAYLQKLRIVDSVLRLDDRQRGVVWDASQLDVVMQREPQGLNGHFHATLGSQSSAARLQSQWSYQRASSLFNLQVEIDNLRPAALPHVLPGSTELAGLNVPLAAQLNLSADLQGNVKTLTFQLSGGAGQLSHPALLPTPLPLTSLTARGHLDEDKGTLHLDQFALNLGTTEAAGPSIQATAVVSGLHQAPALQAEVTLKTFQIADLKHYWPVGVLEDAGAWLTGNMVRGTIDQAHLNLAMALPGGKVKSTTVKQLDGTLRYHGIEVHYFRPLPPCTDVRGSASFNQQGFRIKVDSGDGPFRLLGGDVDITGLDAGRDAIRIRVDIDTPVRDALTLISHPDLDLLSSMGIQAADTGGHARLQTEFAFPLRGKISFDKVRIKVDGTVQDAALHDVLLGQTVDQGALQLSLDNDGMHIKGAAHFAGIPLTLNWNESFDHNSRWRRDLQAQAARVSPADLQRLGVDLPVVIKGSFPATVQVRSSWHDRHVVQATVDLQKTAVTVAQLGWQKNTGAPAKAHGTFHIDETTGITTGDFEANAAALSGRGSVRFNRSQGGITKLDLHEPVLGNTHLKRLTLARQDGDINIRLGAGVVDLQPLLASRTDSQPQAHKRGPAAAPRVHVRAPALQRVYFAPHRYLQDVKLDLTQQAGRLASLNLFSRIPAALVRHVKSGDKHPKQPDGTPNSPAFTVTYHPAAQAAPALSVQTVDLGATLRALNLYDGLTGGHTAITGNMAKPQADDTLQGSIEITDFVIKDAPFLAHLLAVASFQGILNELHSAGLRFSRFLGDFSLQKTTLTATDWRAAGGGLGLTAQGTIDLGAGALDLNGTVVPGRFLNTLPGKIPLLGELLVGGKGHGVIAVNYRAHGDASNPKISVNPASALTPGFLRGIFDVFKHNDTPETGSPSDTSTPPTSP